jgi:hypothetical protein
MLVQFWAEVVKEQQVYNLVPGDTPCPVIRLDYSPAKVIHNEARKK